MNRVEVRPAMLRWAYERSGVSASTLKKRFPKLEAWEQEAVRPTLKQLEGFAKATYTPIGFFFLPAPPAEAIPIPDFRTMPAAPAGRPSANLLDTIYICQQRQEWYREYARFMGEEALPFVGSVRPTAGIVETAAQIRHTLGFDLNERAATPTWEDALRRFIAQADDLGILVMCSGVVLNNNRRSLDPEEFRGFAMADPLAPVVFINGADSKSAQMFTLAHEIAHVWLGQSAVSDARPSHVPDHVVERWCNAVAAEILVPLDVMREAHNPRADLAAEVPRLARRFKVSTLVILRRIFDIGRLDKEAFWQAYDAELERLRELTQKGGGGNFYLTQAARVSKRFARALVANTLEGQTLYSDAFQLLGFAKVETFRELGRSLGVIT